VAEADGNALLGPCSIFAQIRPKNIFRAATLAGWTTEVCGGSRSIEVTAEDLPRAKKKVRPSVHDECAGYTVVPFSSTSIEAAT
jgi:hypothetical protein